MNPSVSDRFRELIEILQKLRAPDGCPWDREQTFDSLRPYLLEETYEILEIIDEKRYAKLREELGDLLLHIVFQAQIAAEMNLFDIADVLDTINQKLIRRHPHVFGDVHVESARQVEKNWENIKLGEKNQSVLGGVPQHLPALLRAYRVQEKASGVGFDWKSDQDVLTKIREEIRELSRAKSSGRRDRVEDEFGDLLFSLVNLARFWGVTPEDALQKTVRKFIRRFNYIETGLKKKGKSANQATLEEMDALWEEAKTFVDE